MTMGATALEAQGPIDRIAQAVVGLDDPEENRYGNQHEEQNVDDIGDKVVVTCPEEDFVRPALNGPQHG